MTKVVALAHVKASASSAASSSSSGRRIPWLGGKLVSNKEEALRKFYERKVNAGGAFNARQIDALQKSLGITVNNEHVGAKSSSTHHQHQQQQQQQVNPKKLHATHRPHGKVQASTNKTIVVNGRVLGPKVAASHQHHAASRFVKAPGSGKKGSRAGSPGGSPKELKLEDKLQMSLDALVGGQKRVRK